MNLALLYLKGKTSEWADAANEDYAQKISHFFTFERKAIKSKSSDRENAADKIRAESEALLTNIEKNDFVILFDENGKAFDGSIDFSKELIKCISQNQRRVLFIIGGPYGFSNELKQRANAKWSLSGLTMNHHIAQVAALEQIYRGLTIWKGLPYHNI